ncbi:sigma-54-dependent Fis family transcriptional regulator [Oceanidesulfovibrio marinus]|uniref:Hydrogenase n=1 Tax=Oceanidesulfovibrio marinus TaxID=370038 RepID=A0A6P1ZEV2_9BACT|nr:sigma-54-dependent Fis family transcriptional regulator [Oceanidesulfovibrio marinus]QJT08701.1 sigma-54-dependent Fis family transcriptional regulator [Oceanidesulfovibrio marinus]TVM32462.1 hydrogenase [Oceanidesulfovibrio marinus]
MGVPVAKNEIRAIARSIAQELHKELEKDSTRPAFFQALAGQLRQFFEYDRLCINLYDPHSDLLSYFSAAAGTVVNSLSPVRKAEKDTVAGHVIASRKPVVITDIAQHFTESMLHPMAEAGLTTTMAFPLVLNDNILGTLHCSFVRQPEDLYSIMKLFLELCPSVAVCLGAVLSVEGHGQDGASNPFEPAVPPVDCDDFIFVDETMRHFMYRVNTVARLDVPVLLLGETGTGKTHLARYIHCHSKRSKQNFVKVNCPALSPTLIESELFGHAKGAFTGAANKRMGRFELANEGTLFLDEIAELNSDMQSKLLHVIEDRHFERVGESVSLGVDIRLITATNVNVQEAMANRQLRSDFYHRLSVCTLELPPLRKRVEDIPVLARFFVKQLSSTYGMQRIKFKESIMSRLKQHTWPGNIRELRNVINTLLLSYCMTGDVALLDVEEALSNGHAREDAPEISVAPRVEEVPSPSGPDMSLEEMERRHITEALKRCGGVVSGPNGAAKILGIPRSTLQHRMGRLGISARGA